MNNQTKITNMMKEINSIILGKEEIITQITAAFLVNGHVLLEDAPGVGKTTMALAFSKVMGLKHGRIQFTPDVLPSDINGFHIYNKEKNEWIYKQGSVFCNLLLADEINRASPKTQSALLEVMEERQVTVEGETKEVPNPFLVIATQNPFGSAGTHLLPPAQIDRFMICTTIGYPHYQSELEIAKGIDSSEKIAKLQPALSASEFLQMQEEVRNVYVADSIYEYMVQLVTTLRKHSDIGEGPSPRATIALVKMAKAMTWLQGKAFVSPQEVIEQFPAVMGHRIVLSNNFAFQDTSKERIIEEVIHSVKMPPLWEE